MKFWVVLLLLLLVACAAAFGWQALASDPGYVLVRFGATSVESTLVFAVTALLLLWGLLSVGWRLLRWPLAAWSRSRRRRGRERIASGLVALAEGRYQHATRELERASHQSGLRAPALLAAARAAHARGEHARAEAALDEAATQAAPAALALRARFALERDDPAAALALLKGEADKSPMSYSTLSPSALQLLVKAASRCGEHALALDALGRLAKTQTLASEPFAAQEERVLAAALAAAADIERLNALWSGLTRAQRRLSDAIDAYSRRAAAFGQPLLAISEIETALRRDWSERLVRCYGELGEAEVDTRLRHAEAWLGAQPNSAGLLLTLGRLCIQSKLWGKAREYLERGLGVEPSPALWEALAECCTGQGQAAAAATCLKNALRSTRGEPTQPLSDLGPGALDTRASVVEERSEHGVPRLALPRA